MRHHLVVMLREGEGREASPTAAVTMPRASRRRKGGSRGWDAPKRRKRHGAVDKQRPLLGVVVHAADIQDADGFQGLLRRPKPLYPWLRAVFADSIRNRPRSCWPASCSAWR